MLLLEYEAGECPDGGYVACKWAVAKHENKEAVGHAFHRFAMLQAGLLGKSESVTDEKDSDDDAAAKRNSRLLDDKIPEGVSWKGSKKRKKKDADKLDYYKLLGLENTRWMATDSQIKKAYQRTALEHHPDKALAGSKNQADKERIEAHFLQCQEAFEHLSDAQKRREFDSVDEFDDSLPESCASEDFFRVFGPAFRRQSRWSVSQPVPDLGEEDDADRAVDKFYKFWFAFKSWREFPHPDEEDVDQAEGRDHRRWIERINAKLREKPKKEEVKRLKAFVEVAFQQDPRMMQRRAAEKAEKDARKSAKDEAKRAAQAGAESKARAEAEAKAAAAEAEATSAAEAKKVRQLERKAMQKERSKIRSICSNAEDGRLLGDYETEQLCEKLTLLQLSALREGLEGRSGSRAGQQSLLRENQALIGQKVSAEQIAKEAAAEAVIAQAAAQRQQEAASRNARMASWTPDEKRLLEKALTKFPVGTAKRWAQVAAAVRTRTEAEVIDMAKHGLRGGAGAPKSDTSFSLAGKRSKVDINSNATARNEVFTDVDVNLAASAASSNGKAAASNGFRSSRSSPARPATPEPLPAASPHSGEWSETQQLALVAAMKKFGKDVEDRWERIAADVEGKTKAQCFKRFKELRQTFRASKV